MSNEQQVAANYRESLAIVFENIQFEPVTRMGAPALELRGIDRDEFSTTLARRILRPALESGLIPPRNIIAGSATFWIR